MPRNSTLSNIFISTKKRIGSMISHIVKPDDIAQETFIKTYKADLNQEISSYWQFIIKCWR